MRVRLNQFARVEAREARQWYSSQSRTQAVAFLAELARVRRTVGRYPEAGLAASTTHRRFVMDGFPYAVFYRIDGPEVAIVAVAHTSRRPGYWLNR